YGFNGKERDQSMGTSLVYDYGFRIYNPSIGKFLSVDPLTKEYPWNSSYAYAENDVIRSVDLDGLERAIRINYHSSDQSTQTHVILVSGISLMKETEALHRALVGTGMGIPNDEGARFNSSNAFWESGFEEYKGIRFRKGRARQFDSNTGTGELTIDIADDYYTFNYKSAVTEDQSFNKALEERTLGQLYTLSSVFQNGGDAATLTGLGISATGAGAPFGAPLAVAGKATSFIGSGLELGLDFFTEDYESLTLNASVLIFNKIVPGDIAGRVAKNGASQELIDNSLQAGFSQLVNAGKIKPKSSLDKTKLNVGVLRNIGTTSATNND
ncbi:MAG: RHS repeat-associated core domain-containing protein, partial [Cyclobacteriaceae bacterium]